MVAAFSATNAPIYRLQKNTCLQCTVDVSAVPKTSLSCRGLESSCSEIMRSWGSSLWVFEKSSWATWLSCGKWRIQWFEPLDDWSWMMDEIAIYFQSLRNLDDVHGFPEKDGNFVAGLSPVRDRQGPTWCQWFTPMAQDTGLRDLNHVIIQVEMGRNPMDNPGKSDPYCPRLPWFLSKPSPRWSPQVERLVPRTLEWSGIIRTWVGETDQNLLKTAILGGMIWPVSYI